MVEEATSSVVVPDDSSSSFAEEEDKSKTTTREEEEDPSCPEDEEIGGGGCRRRRPKSREMRSSTASGDDDSETTRKTTTSAAELPSRSSRPSRIAFGSCNNQNLTQPLWDVVIARKPIAFVWAGDAIYADHNLGLDWTKFPPASIHQSATPSELRQYYSLQRSHPGYRKLLSTNLTVFGTVDDHDYGCNNGDENYVHKRESGMAFVDFTGEQEGSPIWKRARMGKGVYGAKVFDFDRPSGEELVSDVESGLDPDVVAVDDRSDEEEESSFGSGSRSRRRNRRYSKNSVAIFVLDVRTNRTPWPQGLDGWRPNDDGDFLGEEQWSWFEEALGRSEAAVNVVVNGLQVHSNRFPAAHIAEEWSKFPRSRDRLYDALLRNGVEAPILVSGDVHMSQLMRRDCFRRGGGTGGKLAEENRRGDDHDDGREAGEGGDDDDDADARANRRRSLVEFTTSGLTHSWGTCFASSEKIHKSWYYPYFHLASRTLMEYGHFACPWTELLFASSSAADDENAPRSADDDDRRGRGGGGRRRPPPKLYENGGAENAKLGLQYALDLNFGEMEFDWTDRTVSMRAFGRSSTTTKKGGDDGGEAERRPPLLSAKFSFDQLSGRDPMPDGVAAFDRGGARDEASRGGEGGGVEWYCVNHRGRPNPIREFWGLATGTALIMFFLLAPYGALGLGACSFLRYGGRARKRRD